jgi:hypothetical protein
MPGSQADQLESQLKNLKAMQGMGLALSVVDEGVQLDSAASFDLSKLDKQMADQIEARTPRSRSKSSSSRPS